MCCPDSFQSMKKLRVFTVLNTVGDAEDAATTSLLKVVMEHTGLESESGVSTTDFTLTMRDLWLSVVWWIPASVVFESL